ncbi:acetoacetyl-CoA synthetase, partial [Trichonephila inaurata madagascariensis]
CFLKEFLKLDEKENGRIPAMTFEQVSFSHPVTINYTSGTTGLPKAIVHGSGVLLTAANSTLINFDCDRNSRWFFIMPMGTAAWLFHSVQHFLGETLVLYEGNPYFLSPTYFWDLLEKYKISHHSIFQEQLMKLEKGISPKRIRKPSKIQPFGFFLTSERLCLVELESIIEPELSLSFTITELNQVSLLTETSLPAYRGEINAACLGTSIEVIDHKGNSLIGEVGDIALMKPLPSFFLGIWNDVDGSICRKKYFSKYSEIFALGDCGIINPITKGWIVCFRSDEALNPKGYRFGPSEIYSIVETFPEVWDSLCVSKYTKTLEEYAILFIKMKEGYSCNEELTTKIRQAVEKLLSILCIPDLIIEVQDIPYNMTGKKMEILVKKIINSQPHDPIGIRNTECLQYYYDVPALREL